MGKLGDNPNRKVLHLYVKYHLSRPEKCEICKIRKPIDLATKSGKYVRDLDDWFWLCRICHMAYDKKMGMRNQSEANRKAWRIKIHDQEMHKKLSLSGQKRTLKRDNKGRFI
jgi:hypothetical protein